jgi:hypothetical protein
MQVLCKESFIEEFNALMINLGYQLNWIEKYQRDE